MAALKRWWLGGLARPTWGPMALKQGADSAQDAIPEHHAFYRDHHARTTLRRFLIALVAATEQSWVIANFAQRGLATPLIQVLYIISLSFVAIIMALEALFIVQVYAPWWLRLAKPSSTRSAPVSVRLHDGVVLSGTAIAGGAGLEAEDEARTAAQEPILAPDVPRPSILYESLFPVKPRWMFDSAALDASWCAVLLMCQVAVQGSFLQLCSNDILKLESATCIAYSSSQTPGVPVLFTGAIASAVPMVSAQPLINFVTVLCCIGLLITQWILFQTSIPGARINAIGLRRAGYAVPAAAWFLALLAVAVLLARTKRTSFRRLLLSERRFKQYTEAVQERVIQARIASVKEAAARAETAAAVSNATLSYTFHTLRNPVHTMLLTIEEWRDMENRGEIRDATEVQPGAAPTAALSLQRVQAAPGPLALPGLHTLQSSVRQIVHRVDQAGRHAAILSGDVTFNPRPTLVRPWLDDVIRQWTAMMQARVLAHTHGCPGARAVVDGTVPEQVVIDPGLMGDILSQAMENAGREVRKYFGRQCTVPDVLMDALQSRGLPRTPIFVLLHVVERTTDVPQAGQTSQSITPRGTAGMGGQAAPGPVSYSVGQAGGVGQKEVADGSRHAPTQVLVSPAHAASTLPPAVALLRFEVCNLGSGLPRDVPTRALFSPFVAPEPGHDTPGRAVTRSGSLSDRLRGLLMGRTRSRSDGQEAGLATGEVQRPSDAAPPASGSGSRDGQWTLPGPLRLRARRMGFGLSIIRLICGLVGGTVRLSDEPLVPPQGQGPSRPPAALSESTTAEPASAGQSAGAVLPAQGTTAATSTVYLTRLVVEVPLILPSQAVVAAGASAVAGMSSTGDMDTGGQAGEPTAEAPVTTQAGFLSSSPPSPFLYPSSGIWAGGPVPTAGQHQRLISPLEPQGTLPGQATAEPSAAVAAGVSSPSPGPAEPLAGLRFLVVDDEGSVRRATERMLSRAGAAVDTRKDGGEVLSAIQQASSEGRPYQCVLLDVIMQRVNGDVACRAVREAGYGHDTLPILAATGNTSPADVREYMLAGFTGVLGKPFLLNDVLAALGNATASMQTAGQAQAAAATGKGSGLAQPTAVSTGT